MTTWDVYKADRRAADDRRMLGRFLGTVQADTQPEALALAWERWPTEKDPNQVQAGFSLRQHHQLSGSYMERELGRLLLGKKKGV